MHVYSLPLTLGAGASSMIELRLLGDIDLDAGYELVVPAQPLARPDIVEWRVVRSDGEPLARIPGWRRDGGALVLDELLRRNREFTIPLDSSG